MFRIPGALCASNTLPADEGTLPRWRTSLPGPVCGQALPSGSTPTRAWRNFSRAGGFSAATLALSPDAVALLKGIETLRLTPYDDQTGKDTSVWVSGATIGYGHLIAKKDWATYKNGISTLAAEQLFRADAAPFEQAVGKSIIVGVQQYEFDAMVILAYNIGESGFTNSSVVRLVNQVPRDSFALEQAWKAWNKSQGKVSRGLENRRAAEWRIFTEARYERW